MVKVGDKVRFLNAVGGGTVVKISKDIAYVEEEDGFETPVLMHECVVIEPAQKAQKSAAPAMKTAETPQPTLVRQPEEEQIEIVETPEGDRLNVTLAFLPFNEKSLSTSRFDAYLINDSNYFLFFTLLNRTGQGWTTRHSGLVEPNIQLHLETFGPESLNDLEHLCFQAVAFKKEKPFALKNSLSTEHRLDTVKFYKLHSFRENDYFDENALLLPLVRNDVPEQRFEPDAAALEKALRSKKNIDRPRSAPAAPKLRKSSEPVVVDLHIHELLDTTAGLSNSDMLNCQLDKFRETLEAYKNILGQKIIFIHGKGEGVLRKAIWNELRTRYRHHDYQDASFREYGFGATQVTIRQSK